MNFHHDANFIRVLEDGATSVFSTEPEIFLKLPGSRFSTSRYRLKQFFESYLFIDHSGMSSLSSELD